MTRSQAVALLKEAERRRQRRDGLLAAVAEDFELSPEACCRKYVVHALVAKRLGVELRNELVLDLRAALESVPGFRCFTRSGRGWYRGLRPRDASQADLVPRPNLWAKRSDSTRQLLRERALEREARKRSADVDLRRAHAVVDEVPPVDGHVTP